MVKQKLPERKVRRVFWDIEVTPNLVWSWRIGYNVNLTHESIVKERKVICIAYKWEGDKKVTVLRWDKDQDDREMLIQFAKVAEEADEMVAQYGDGFDLPWFRTRYIIHGLEPIPTYKTIDTKAWASKNFYFNSNKLDYLGHVLGVGRKLETKYQLWLDVMAGSKKALDYMCRYCGDDVLKLEGVYLKLSRFVKPKTHAGVLAGYDKWTCPRDGSRHVRKSKTIVTASGTIQHRMKCMDCGGYYVISDRAYRDYQESKRK